MVTSVLVSISVKLSLELSHYRMHSYTYYRNSIVGQLADKDSDTCLLHLTSKSMVHTHVSKYSGQE